MFLPGLKGHIYLHELSGQLEPPGGIGAANCGGHRSLARWQTRLTRQTVCAMKRGRVLEDAAAYRTITRHRDVRQITYAPFGNGRAVAYAAIPRRVPAGPKVVADACGKRED